ncbi:MAG: hypothetical protein J6R01_05465 [Alistipes sp.]|nr:hypothetical protein [Alistipes sp.]
MKRSGRTLKQRLYGLKHIGSYVRRARYFRGHGVHSPYIYSIVRQVFMSSKLNADGCDLHDALLECGVPQRRAVELQNLVHHCRYTSWSIDSIQKCDMLVATMNTTYEYLDEYARYAQEQGVTLCIIRPYDNANRWAVCSRIIEEHPSTTVDNRGYLLVFNNHLPKQRFRL